MQLEVYSSGTDTDDGVFLCFTWNCIHAKIIADSTQASPLGGKMAFQTATDMRFDFDRMLFSYAGNAVGIGTDSPTQGKVDILNNGDYDAHTGHGLTINSSASNAFTSMYMGADDSVDAAYIQSAGRNTSFTTKKLLLNPNGGNVGIGTNTPSAKLDYCTLKETMLLASF